MVGQFEVGDISGFVLAKIEVHAGFVDFNDGLEPLEQLLASLVCVKGSFGFGYELQNLVANTEPGLLELDSGEAFSQREHEQVEEILSEGEFGPGSGGRSIREAHAREEFRIAD